MLVVISSIIVALTVLLAAFVNFAPNVHSIVEKDFRRRATTNSHLYSLQKGQLAIRAGNLTEGGTLNVSTFTGPTSTEYLYQEDSNAQNNMDSSVTYSGGNMTVTSTYTAN